MKRIYLDYASLTPIDKAVMKEMNKYSTGDYTNSSSLYASGIQAKKAIQDARIRIANVLHAHPDEIIFTSGGTESNHLVLEKFKNNTHQIIISSIEHSSILKSSLKTTHIPVDKHGYIDLEFLKNSLTPETKLVSVMMVNNEIGVIEPIHEISKIIRDANKKFDSTILFHTDACQAAVHLPLYVEKLGVDMMSLDGQKMYGPRGVGILYIKRSVQNYLNESKIVRAGTENTPAIMGCVLALELAEKRREDETLRIALLKSFFIQELQKINPEITVNGSLSENVTPHILNISIPNIDNEFFVLQLDAQGIECSTKSACLIDEDESYVLKAIGADSKTSVRFSFGKNTTKGDLKKVLKAISKILQKSK